MPSRTRRWTERLSLGGLAVVGFADLLGWLDRVAPKGVATLTLLLVSGVIVVLLTGDHPTAHRY
jgi:hypothetical protein